MKSKFMRGLALGLAMVTAFTFSAPNSALLNAQAAKAKMTASAKSIKAGGTVTYKVTNLNKKYYYTVKVTGAGKKLVQVKKGKTTVKAYKKTAVSKKAKVGAKTLTLKATNNSKKTSAQKYTVTVKVYKTKNAKKAFKTFKTTTTIKKKAAAKKIAATGVTLDKEAYTVGLNQNITLFATPVPADTTDKAVWTSSDETVATVANGVVTGVKEGTADITVTYGSVSATAKVTVSKDAIIYNLTSAKQTAANKVELTFDNAEAKNLTQKGDILIQNAAKSITLPVDSFAWSADGTTAIATLSISFVDKTDYTVQFKEGAAITLTASVGEVASASITTASAQRGVDTRIEYMLLDANGMDVTSTVNLKDKVTLEQTDGVTESTDLGDPTKPTIRMASVGDTAEITVTYRKSDDANITAKATITCIEAAATTGNGVFTTIKDRTPKKLIKEVSSKDVAKFYLSGMSDTVVNVDEDSTEDYVYFYAKDDNGKAIKYDEWKIDSANNDVVGAELDGTETDSKYIKIKVTGNKKGTANLNVTATKNGINTPYSIPVSVNAKPVLSSLTAKVDRATITNAHDTDYYGEITVQAKDTNGNIIQLSEAPSIKFNNKDQKVKVVSKGAASVSYVEDVTGSEKGFYFDNTSASVQNPSSRIDNSETYSVNMDDRNTGRVDRDYQYKAFYSAYGAESGTYTLKVTGTLNGVVKTTTVSVRVDKIANEAWYTDGTSGVNDIKYAVELKDKTRDFNDGDTHTTAKLYATVGSKFVGYVRTDRTSTGNAAWIGGDGVTTNDAVSVKSGCTNRIRNIVQYVEAPSGKITNDPANAKLYDATTNVQSSAGSAVGLGTGQQVSMGIDVADTTATEAVYVKGDDTNDKYFAKLGKYTVTFKYNLMNDKNESKSATAALEVKNSMYIPTINVVTRKVDSLSFSTIRENLETSVDIVNNESAYDSISDSVMYSKFTKNVGTTATESSDGKNLTVKYVAVKEPMNGYTNDVVFLIPINTTFLLNE